MRRLNTNQYYAGSKYNRKRSKLPIILIIVVLLCVSALGFYFYHKGSLQILLKKEEPAKIAKKSKVKTDEQLLKEINENSDFYPEGFVDLANKYPDTINFVYGYKGFVKKENTYTPDDIDITSDVKEGEVPLFIQWDPRWGYFSYGDTEDTIAISGCGPTSLAMVLVSLTGDTNINPKTVADFSYNEGYYVHEAGTSWTLMSEGAEKLGLKVSETNVDNIIPALKDGKLIIASMNPGDFTTTGHIIVLRGVTKENKIIVNDSNSIINSKKEWDLDVFKNQAANFWVYSLPQEN